VLPKSQETNGVGDFLRFEVNKYNKLKSQKQKEAFLDYKETKRQIKNLDVVAERKRKIENKKKRDAKALKERKKKNKEKEMRIKYKLK
jgi:hypothetical protein